MGLQAADGLLPVDKRVRRVWLSNGGVRPTSDGDLIDIVKFQLRAQKGASAEEIEAFYYDVKRP